MKTKIICTPFKSKHLLLFQWPGPGLHGSSYFHILICSCCTCIWLWDSLWGRPLTWPVSYWELRWRDDQRRALIDLNAYFLQTHKCIFVFSFQFNIHFWGEEDREGRAKIGVHFVQLMHLKGGHLATSWLTIRIEFFIRYFHNWFFACSLVSIYLRDIYIEDLTYESNGRDEKSQ